MEGSIEDVTARLKSWGARWDRGLARVEWDSAFARREVVARLKEQLGSQGIALAEIALPAGQTGFNTVRGLLEKLRSLGDAVVSITDLEWAFPKHGDVMETLFALNFQRESLAALPLRQIWWMPGPLVDRFVVTIPDLESWFQLRLHLTEVPASPMQLGPEMQATDRRTVSVEEARSLARRFWDRLDAARAQKIPEERILTELAQPAVDALQSAGLELEAADILARMPEAREDLERQIQELVASRGRDDPQVLWLRLARLLHRQGDYAGARRIEESLLEVQTCVLGEEHLDTLTAMGNLALTLWSQGDHAGARGIEERVLALRTRVLGEEHPSTLTAMNNLAQTLWSQRDYSTARRLQERVLAVRTSLLGEEHLDTLSAMGNLALTLASQGDDEGARRLEERVLEVRRRTLGEEHPDTLTAMNNLAGTLVTQGDYAGARRLEEQVLEVAKRMLGEEHPGTLTMMANLALNLFEAGDTENALQLARECLVARRKVLGDNHPATLATANLLKSWEARSAGHPR